MIDTIEHDRKFIIPPWLELKKSIQSGELNPLFANENTVDTKHSIDLLKQDYDAFKKNTSLREATDLLGTADFLKEDEIACELANYVLSNRDKVNPITVDFACNILNINDANSTNSFHDNSINEKIKMNKTYLKNFPKNAFKWLEQARLYTIKAQIKKAEKAVIIALLLNPTNRYVARSGARFFLHIDDADQALFFLKKALQQNRQDPWIKACEVNIKMYQNKKIDNINKKMFKKLTHEEIFHYSELIESFAMLEVDSGNDKIAKKELTKAWVNPSRNVTTHSEWVIRNRFPQLKSQIKFSLKKTPEGATWHYYWKKDLEKALEYITSWILEEPYSTHPYTLGSYLSSIKGDYNNAATMSRKGLKVNPNNFGIQNNLCYNLLKSGDIKEAQNLLSKLHHNDDTELITHLATNGLLMYKLKDLTKGRRLYEKAISLSDSINNKSLKEKALLNYALAEIDANGENGIAIAQKALEESKNDDAIDIYFIKKRLKGKLEKTLSSKNIFKNIFIKKKSLKILFILLSCQLLLTFGGGSNARIFLKICVAHF